MYFVFNHNGTLIAGKWSASAARSEACIYTRETGNGTYIKQGGVDDMDFSEFRQTADFVMLGGSK